MTSLRPRACDFRRLRFSRNASFSRSRRGFFPRSPLCPSPLSFASFIVDLFERAGENRWAKYLRWRLWRKHADGPGRAQNGQKSARAADEPVQPGRSGSHLALSRRIVTSICFTRPHGRSRDAPIIPEPANATPASETGYVPAMAIASLGDPVSIKAV